jgi:hypothetical protein
MNYKLVIFFSISNLFQLLKAQDYIIQSFDNQPIYFEIPAKSDINTAKVYRLYLENVGKISTDINRLKNLQSLNIAGNDWDYELDSLPEILGDLRDLRHFSLFNTNVKNLGNWLTKCKNLSSLSLGKNSIDSLPSFLSQLPKLQEITLVDYPFSLPLLPHLETLTIYYNHQETVFRNWPFKPNQNLKHLIIKAYHPNLFDQIGSFLEPLKKLESLTIKNSLEGKNTAQLIHLQQLKELNLESYEGKAQTLSFLVNLKKLKIQKISSKDEKEDIKIIQAIQQLPFLESFETTYRPEHLEFYKKFKKLHLYISDQNRLTESDCQSLSKLPHLQSISLSEIPPHLALLQNITSLDLSQFKFQLLDVFTQKITGLANLEHLTLSAATLNNQWNIVRQCKTLKTLTITNCRNNLSTEMQISLQEILSHLKVMFVY